jgi:hypothetical protein
LRDHREERSHSDLEGSVTHMPRAVRLPVEEIVSLRLAKAKLSSLTKRPRQVLASSSRIAAYLWRILSELLGSVERQPARSLVFEIET